MGGLSNTGQRGHGYHSALANRHELVGEGSERLKLLRASGEEVQQIVREIGGGKLIASAKDGDGNIIGLIQSP